MPHRGKAGVCLNCAAAPRADGKLCERCLQREFRCGRCHKAVKPAEGYRLLTNQKMNRAIVIWHPACEQDMQEAYAKNIRTVLQSGGHNAGQD